MTVGNLTSPGRTKEHTEEVYLWNEYPDVLLFDIVDQVRPRYNLKLMGVAP